MRECSARRSASCCDTSICRRATAWVFSSLHTSVGMAFVGAVVGEYLGSAKGVGYLILQAEGVFDINTVLAGILVLTAFALVLDVVVTRVESAPARLAAGQPRRPKDCNKGRPIDVRCHRGRILAREASGAGGASDCATSPRGGIGHGHAESPVVVCRGNSVDLNDVDWER